MLCFLCGIVHLLCPPANTAIAMALTNHIADKGLTTALLLSLLSSVPLKIIEAVDTTVIVLTVSQSYLATSNTSSANFMGDDGSSGYFPLSDALESVMRLASDDINAGGSESLGLTEGDLQMVVARVNSGTQAMEGFCNALEAVGGNGTFGVSASSLQQCGTTFCTCLSDTHPSTVLCFYHCNIVKSNYLMKY